MSIAGGVASPPAPKDGAIRMTQRNGIRQFLNRSKIPEKMALRLDNPSLPEKAIRSIFSSIPAKY
jgi:hypothetical protein